MSMPDRVKEWLEYIKKPDRKKNIIIYVGSIYVCLGRNVPSNTLINFLGEERVNWLNTHKPEKIELSIDNVEIRYRKSAAFEKLCGFLAK